MDLLSDVRENKRMQEKLPEWIVRKWARIVANYIKVGPFPSFEVFVKFLAAEADIACNPCIFSKSDKSDTSGKASKSQDRHHVLATGSTEESNAKKQTKKSNGKKQSSNAKKQSETQAKKSVEHASFARAIFIGCV